MAMTFEVELWDPAKDGAPPKKTIEKSGPPKWELLGIQVRKYMLHPTCPFCGLEDFGKQAVIRPDPHHMVRCRERTLDPKPVTLIEILNKEGKETGEHYTKGRDGSFAGEGAARMLRIPVRQVMRFEEPVLDESGQPTGEVEPRFACTYKWRMVEVNDWIWNGTEWVEWYKWRPAAETEVVTRSNRNAQVLSEGKVATGNQEWFDYFCRRN